MRSRLFYLLAVTLLPATVLAQEPLPEPTPAGEDTAAPADGQVAPETAADTQTQPGQETAAEGEAPATEAEPPPTPEPPEMPEPPVPPVEPPPPTPTGDAASADAGADEILLSDWDSDDWLLVKPRISLVDLDGYFRLRGDLYRGLDFKNESTGWPNQSGIENDSENVRRTSDFTSANIRLRLEPTINVASNIHIVTTIDILDNLVLGSTPNTLPPIEGQTPLNLLNTGQIAPSDGVNAVMDSIVVKRAYARVTALNEQLELRFGRMPNHWGLGMMANSGDCLDCDSGDVADRVQLSFKAADHVFSAMFDWGGSGPIYQRFGDATGQAIDAVDWDDIDQYSVRIQKVDHPDDIKDAVANDDWILNYGIWGSWRLQYRDLGSDYYIETVEQDGVSMDFWRYDPARELNYEEIYEERRDANVVTIDAFGRFYYGPFKASLEAAFVWGKFSDQAMSMSTDTGPVSRDTEMLTWGAAAELSYKLSEEYAGVEILLNAGVASGDSAPGWGALSEASGQRGFFRGDEVQDLQLTNFQFNPNYHVDLLMYRTIIGTVTDSFYISPGASYDFDENINIRGHVTYTNAIFKRSTQSCYSETSARCIGSETNNADPGAREMGLEVDAEVSYGLFANPDGNAFRASIRGGLLFPFGAFNNPDLIDPVSETAKGPEFAWTIQTRLYITY